MRTLSASILSTSRKAMLNAVNGQPVQIPSELVQQFQKAFKDLSVERCRNEITSADKHWKMAESIRNALAITGLPYRANDASKPTLAKGFAEGLFDNGQPVKLSASFLQRHATAIDYVITHWQGTLNPKDSDKLRFFVRVCNKGLTVATRELGIDGETPQARTIQPRSIRKRLETVCKAAFSGGWTLEQVEDVANQVYAKHLKTPKTENAEALAFYAAMGL